MLISVSNKRHAGIGTPSRSDDFDIKDIKEYHPHLWMWYKDRYDWSMGAMELHIFSGGRCDGMDRTVAYQAVHQAVPKNWVLAL